MSCAASRALTVCTVLAAQSVCSAAIGIVATECTEAATLASSVVERPTAIKTLDSLCTVAVPLGEAIHVCYVLVNLGRKGVVVDLTVQSVGYCGGEDACCVADEQDRFEAEHVA